jgi:signal transduction histidine kinase
VKNAVEKMGGTIDLESQESVGSTFKVSIPVMDAASN